jgi:hypothetical protein
MQCLIYPQLRTWLNSLRTWVKPPTLLQITTKIIYTLPPHLRGFIATWESLPEEEQTITLFATKILNEESKNAMFQPQGTYTPSYI